ncbi:MAG: S-layer homology domain-containing protein [Thermoclostridium sp.]|nr:S-layer homology domain-containing protein [Thermoclostridium sp.]
MKMKIMASIMLVAILLTMAPNLAFAAYSHPTVLGAPMDVGVKYDTAYGDDFYGFDITVTAPEDVRNLIDAANLDDSQYKKEGYSLKSVMLQVDYKLDSGSWHYASTWDENLAWMTNMTDIRLLKGTYTNVVAYLKDYFAGIPNGDPFPEINNKAFFDTHSMDFRTRFIITSSDSNLGEVIAVSPWSDSVTYSNKIKAENPELLINHAPVLKSAEIVMFNDKPFIRIISEPAHKDVRKLNSISGNAVMIEVWIKKDGSDWVQYGGSGGLNNFSEKFDLDALAEFPEADDTYDAAKFDLKIRYYFNYIAYPEAGGSGEINSPFSNVFSKGTPAYTAASNWAKTELDKANSYGLIPDSLMGADMTKPITREEFAEVAVLLYEKTTGKVSSPISPNPFTDTANGQILKAVSLGIAKGFSATRFAPKDPINREQVATMLSRAIRIMVPNGDFSITGAPEFTDKSSISSWALEHVLFMAKIEIIKGSNGKFMPKAITTSEIAAGYASTTREQALAMSTRIYEKYR